MKSSRPKTFTGTSQRRKTVSWLSSAVLVFNIFAGMAIPSSQAWSALPGMDNSSDAINTVIICTPNGLVQISLDRNGVPIPDQQQSNTICDLCLPLSGGHASTPALNTSLILPSQGSIRAVVAWDVNNAIYSVSLVTRPPRAPPAQYLTSGIGLYN